MNPVESRPLRYFVAVAEELNYARAAERLGIASPALSRTISQLEAQLGVRLLERSTRRVTLTTAGEVLLDESRAALAALDAAARRAQRAAGPQRRLVVALKADLDGGLLQQTMDIYERAVPDAPVEVLLGGWGEQTGQLVNGRADVALVYDPVTEPGIDSETIRTEPRMAALPSDHPWAARTTLQMADIEASFAPNESGYIWRPRTDPAGDPDRPTVGDISQLLKRIELQQIIALLPASVAARFGRPQISYRPVPDAPPATLSVAWPQHTRSLATATFVGIVTEVAAAEHVPVEVADIAGRP